MFEYSSSLQKLAPGPSSFSPSGSFLLVHFPLAAAGPRADDFSSFLVLLSCPSSLQPPSRTSPAVCFLYLCCSQLERPPHGLDPSYSVLCSVPLLLSLPQPWTDLCPFPRASRPPQAAGPWLSGLSLPPVGAAARCRGSACRCLTHSSSGLLEKEGEGRGVSRPLVLGAVLGRGL